MNATRAATIRLRSAFDGAVSLGRVQTPTLAILARREQEIRDFVPEPYWVIDASFDPTAEPSGRNYEGRYHAGANPRLKTAEEAAAIVADVEGQGDGVITKLTKSRAEAAAAPAVRPDLAAARCQQPLRLPRAAHARGCPAAIRGAHGAHLSADQLALSAERHDPRDQADREARRRAGGVPRRLRVRARARRAAAGTGDQQREGHRSPRDHPDPRRPTSGRQDVRRRQEDLRPRRPPVPGGVPPRGGVREHPRRDDRGGSRVPHARQADPRRGLARGVRRERRLRGAHRRRRGPRAAAAATGPGRAGRGHQGRAPRRR